MEDTFRRGAWYKVPDKTLAENLARDYKVVPHGSMALDLAERLGVTKVSMLRRLRVWQRRGWVEQLPDKSWILTRGAKRKLLGGAKKNGK